MAFIGCLSHLSTCLVEIIPSLQDELWAHLHQLGNESSLALIWSLCTPNKSSVSTLMSKEMDVLGNSCLNVLLPPASATGVLRGAAEASPPFSSALRWQHFAPEYFKFLFLRASLLAQVPRSRRFLQNASEHKRWSPRNYWVPFWVFWSSVICAKHLMPLQSCLFTCWITYIEPFLLIL